MSSNHAALRPTPAQPVAAVLFLVFGGLGFVAHVLWLGLILAVIIGVAHALTGGGRRTRV